MSIKSTLLITVILVSVSATSGPALAAPPGNRVPNPVVERVEGSTYVLLGPSVFGVTVQQDPLAYDAAGYADGSARGQWTYHYYEAGAETMFAGRITCLTVHGNRAWVGGTITRSSDPTQIGMGAWWQLADNGTGRHPVVPDRTTFVGFGDLDQTQAYCDTAPDPHFIFDVQQGGVRIVPTTPR